MSKFKLRISPNVVKRPPTGEKPVTYRFSITGGVPVKRIVNVRNPKGKTHLDIESVNPNARWEGNTLIFPWRVRANEIPGTYLYLAVSTDGRWDIAHIDVI